MIELLNFPPSPDGRENPFCPDFSSGQKDWKDSGTTVVIMAIVLLLKNFTKRNYVTE